VTIRRLVSTVVVCLLLLVLGCDHWRDASNEKPVRDAGVIGACFKIKTEGTIVKSGRGEFDFLVPTKHADTVNNKVVAVVPTATRVRIEKLIRYNYGVLPSPALAPSDIPYTLVRIVDDPPTKELVVLSQFGVAATSSEVDPALMERCEPTTRGAE
jgi:hypothetical protein